MNYLKVSGLLWFLVTMICVPSLASEIYKTVDAYGNVTYSDAPPESGQLSDTLPTVAEPSQSDIQDAKQRLKILMESLKKPIEENVDPNPQQNGSPQNKSKQNNYETESSKLPLFAPFF